MKCMKIVVSVIFIANIVLCKLPNMNSTQLSHDKRNLRSRVKITIEFPLNRKVCGYYNAKYTHGHCERQGREIRIKKVCPKEIYLKCPYRYEPICGDDGVTYQNEYYIRDGVTIVYPGRCHHRPSYDDHCPYSYAPVCGADGITYKNRRCVPSRVKIVFKGTCPPDFELYEDHSTINQPHIPAEHEQDYEIDCPYPYAPVCGNDGVTYKHRRCVKKGIRIVSKGPCSPDLDRSYEDRATKQQLKLDVCPYKYAPVCGDDGITYNNYYCVKKGVMVVSNGPCSSEVQIPLTRYTTPRSTTKRPRKPKFEPMPECPYTYAPVCGDDGVTYRHYLCVKKGVRIVSRGPCPPDFQPTDERSTTKQPPKLPELELDDCPYDYAPVCGSDGETYKNFRCVKNGVSIVSLGPCSSEFEKPSTHYTTSRSTTKRPRKPKFELTDCPYSYKPVCGADGVTYKHFLCVKKGVRVISSGPCSPDNQAIDESSTTKQPPKLPEPELDDCPHEYAPVCGADGVTYKNLHCVKKGVLIVSFGPCSLELEISSTHYTTSISTTPRPRKPKFELTDCPYSYKPVCGADGVTYRHFLCVIKGVRVIASGPCQPDFQAIDERSTTEQPPKLLEPELDDCPYEYAPVCGIDGVTYKHYLCVQKGVVIVSNGSCSLEWERADDVSTTEEPLALPEVEQDSCPYKYEPVCGADGVTYRHKLCVKKDVLIASIRPCSTELEGSDNQSTTNQPEIEINNCPHKYEPVCGTDGVTYKHYLCVKDDVQIAFNGPCSPEPSKLPKTEPDIYCPNPNAPCEPPPSPPCHQTDSKRPCINDEYVSQPQLNLHLATTKAYIDTCVTGSNTRPCPQIHAVSLLGASNIVEPKIDLTPCPYGISQVCGDDGVTYKNPRCVKLGVRVISRGPCQT